MIDDKNSKGLLGDDDLNSITPDLMSDHISIPRDDKSSKESSDQRSRDNLTRLIYRELYLSRRELQSLNKVLPDIKNAFTSQKTSDISNTKGGTVPPSTPPPPPPKDTSGSPLGDKSDKSSSSDSSSSNSTLKKVQEGLHSLENATQSFQRSWQSPGMRAARSIYNTVDNWADRDLARQQSARRTFGTVTTDTDYSQMARDANAIGRRLGYSWEQTLPAVKANMEYAGYVSQEATNRDTQSMVNVARAYELDLNQVSSASGRMTAMGLFQPGQQQKFANMLATSIKENDMQGRESQQLAVLESIAENTASSNATVTEEAMTSRMSLYNMISDIAPAMRGQRGASLVNRMSDLANSNDPLMRWYAGWGTEYAGLHGERQLDEELAKNPGKVYQRMWDTTLNKYGGDVERTKDELNRVLKDEGFTYGDRETIMNSLEKGEAGTGIFSEEGQASGESTIAGRVSDFVDTTLSSILGGRINLQEKQDDVGSSLNSIKGDVHEILDKMPGWVQSVAAIAVGIGAAPLAGAAIQGMKGLGTILSRAASAEAAGASGAGGILKGLLSGVDVAGAAGKFTGTVSKVVLPLAAVATTISAGSNIMDGKYREAAGDVGGLAGAIGGFKLGSAIGGAIGTFIVPVPGVGTTIGAGIGGLVGGIGGLMFGDDAGQWLYDKVLGDDTPKTYDMVSKNEQSAIKKEQHPPIKKTQDTPSEPVSDDSSFLDDLFFSRSEAAELHPEEPTESIESNKSENKSILSTLGDIWGHINSKFGIARGLYSGNYRNAAGSFGALTGTVVGGELGAKLGTLVYPGIGTVAGGLLGGLGGHILGYDASRNIYDTLFGDGTESKSSFLDDLFFSRSEASPLDKAQTLESAAIPRPQLLPESSLKTERIENQNKGLDDNTDVTERNTEAIEELNKKLSEKDWGSKTSESTNQVLAEQEQKKGLLDRLKDWLGLGDKKSGGVSSSGGVFSGSSQSTVPRNGPGNTYGEISNLKITDDPTNNYGLGVDPERTDIENKMWGLAHHIAKKAKEEKGMDLNPENIYRQWAHETDDFTSPLIMASGNIGGLTTSNPTAYHQPEDTTGTIFYRDYLTEAGGDMDKALELSAESYLREYIYPRRELSGKHSIEEWAHTLYETGYFTADPDLEYIPGMKRRIVPKTRPQQIQPSLNASGLGLNKQYDPLYKDLPNPILGGTIGSSGCMNVSALNMYELMTGNRMNIGEFLEGGYAHTSDANDTLAALGITGNWDTRVDTQRMSEIKSAVQSGRPVLWHYEHATKNDEVNNGSGSHAVLITGMTKDGKFVISNPAHEGTQEIDPDYLANYYNGDTINTFIPDSLPVAQSTAAYQAIPQTPVGVSPIPTPGIPLTSISHFGAKSFEDDTTDFDVEDFLENLNNPSDFDPDDLTQEQIDTMTRVWNNLEKDKDFNQLDDTEKMYTIMDALQKEWASPEDYKDWKESLDNYRATEKKIKDSLTERDRENLQKDANDGEFDGYINGTEYLLDNNESLTQHFEDDSSGMLKSALMRGFADTNKKVPQANESGTSEKIVPKTIEVALANQQALDEVSNWVKEEKAKSPNKSVSIKAIREKKQEIYDRIVAQNNWDMEAYEAQAIPKLEQPSSSQSSVIPEESPILPAPDISSDLKTTSSMDQSTYEFPDTDVKDTIKTNCWPSSQQPVSPIPSRGTKPKKSTGWGLGNIFGSDGGNIFGILSQGVGWLRNAGIIKGRQSRDLGNIFNILGRMTGGKPNRRNNALSQIMWGSKRRNKGNVFSQVLPALLPVLLGGVFGGGKKSNIPGRDGENAPGLLERWGTSISDWWNYKVLGKKKKDESDIPKDESTPETADVPKDESTPETADVSKDDTAVTTEDVVEKSGDTEESDASVKETEEKVESLPKEYKPGVLVTETFDPDGTGVETFEAPPTEEQTIEKEEQPKKHRGIGGWFERIWNTGKEHIWGKKKSDVPGKSEETVEESVAKESETESVAKESETSSADKSESSKSKLNINPQMLDWLIENNGGAVGGGFNPNAKRGQFDIPWEIGGAVGGGFNPNAKRRKSDVPWGIGGMGRKQGRGIQNNPAYSIYSILRQAGIVKDKGGVVGKILRGVGGQLLGGLLGGIFGGHSKKKKSNIPKPEETIMNETPLENIPGKDATDEIPATQSDDKVSTDSSEESSIPGKDTKKKGHGIGYWWKEKVMGSVGDLFGRKKDTISDINKPNPLEGLTTDNASPEAGNSSNDSNISGNIEVHLKISFEGNNFTEENQKQIVGVFTQNSHSIIDSVSKALGNVTAAQFQRK